MPFNGDRVSWQDREEGSVATGTAIQVQPMRHRSKSVCHITTTRTVVPFLSRAQKVFWTHQCKRPLALVRDGAAPAQKRVWVVQKTLGKPLLPGPKRVKKDLLHPHLTTLETSPFWAISQVHSIPTLASLAILGICFLLARAWVRLMRHQHLGMTLSFVTRPNLFGKLMSIEITCNKLESCTDLVYSQSNSWVLRSKKVLDKLPKIFHTKTRVHRNFTLKQQAQGQGHCKFLA